METTETTTGAAGRPLAPERLLAARKRVARSLHAVDMQRRNIFSGDASVPLWDAINKCSKRNRTVWNALYTMGCKLQELESEIEKLHIDKLCREQGRKDSDDSKA